MRVIGTLIWILTPSCRWKATKTTLVSHMVCQGEVGVPSSSLVDSMKWQVRWSVSGICIPSSPHWTQSHVGP
ncbi:hypothetical protein CsSME_00012916 [Camellia sinensis var. sinensis]